MIKKGLLILMTSIMAFSSTACGSAKETELTTEVAAVTLTEEEQEILEMMGEDVIAVTDEDYTSVVEELQYHTGEFKGKVYQFEGTYSEEDSVISVSRTLVHDGEETRCGLPLAFLEKEIEDGSWVRVTGIVNEGEVAGETVNVLEVVAIEALPEEGKAVLEWDGSAHEH